MRAKPTWVCQDDKVLAITLKNAYFRFEKSTFEAVTRTMHRGPEGFKIKRDVYAWVLGCPDEREPDLDDGSWQPIGFRYGLPCFFDKVSGECLPNDGSIDVHLWSALVPLTTGSRQGRLAPKGYAYRPRFLYRSADRG
jgi:hypothetical protein